MQLWFRCSTQAQIRAKRAHQAVVGLCVASKAAVAKIIIQIDKANSDDGCGVPSKLASDNALDHRPLLVAHVFCAQICTRVFLVQRTVTRRASSIRQADSAGPPHRFRLWNGGSKAP